MIDLIPDTLLSPTKLLRNFAGTPKLSEAQLWGNGDLRWALAPAKRRQKFEVLRWIPDKPHFVRLSGMTGFGLVIKRQMRAQRHFNCTTFIVHCAFDLRNDPLSIHPQFSIRFVQLHPNCRSYIVNCRFDLPRQLRTKNYELRTL